MYETESGMNGKEEDTAAVRRRRSRAISMSFAKEDNERLAVRDAKNQMSRPGLDSKRETAQMTFPSVNRGSFERATSPSLSSGKINRIPSPLKPQSVSQDSDIGRSFVDSGLLPRPDAKLGSRPLDDPRMRHSDSSETRDMPIARRPSEFFSGEYNASSPYLNLPQELQLQETLFSTPAPFADTCQDGIDDDTSIYSDGKLSLLPRL